ncbi:AMP-binding protein [Paractinoplanes toevensis]|uniref:Amino acid adenylation domain-containing protein n=1 Tax=Paractinoplanes toevensis TaxID=571911 RepID=A0A919TA73_9ACTN|nr:AMP-binding protein [Actinoplanes toevensis]GIM91830.1 hypothetical protein Ato02nite_036230 [Actinoplanes toevensis]
MPAETLHGLVAEHAAERPAATALIHGDERVSYATLDAAADVLAGVLARRGVGPGDIVPLLLPRSAHLVATELAVLKRGAAYTNLNPAWPPARRQSILDQIGAAGPAELPAEPLADLAARRTTAGADVVDPGPAAAATVFFTSGTTGGAKGVVSPHRAVARLFRPGGFPGFGPGHATPLAAALPWDMYAFELWGQLSTGGTSVLIDGDFLLPGALRDLVRTAGVDTVWLTTTLFNLFVDEAPECFDGVRQIYIGGERVSPGHLRRFLRAHPRTPVYNTLGPAESCMVAVWHRIRPADCDLAGGIPIGRAAPGTEVFLLGSDRARCAPGEIGEIYLGGDGLAIGYLGRPEQTTERFVPVPIDGRPRRLYRSGDLAVLDDEGVLHFRGRGDRQLKISGQRIEPDEIETAARAVPGVRDCVVLPITGPDGRVGRLSLCYLATTGGDRPDPLDVRGHLRRVLPAYLVPTTIWAVERFPMTANGKRDTAALLRGPARKADR